LKKDKKGKWHPTFFHLKILHKISSTIVTAV
jgi:hypothetical protein